MLNLGNKMTFLAGAGVGYVLGARAGRERYRQIVDTAGKVWHDPRVQQKADEVQHLAKDAGAAAGSAAASAAASVAETAKDKVQSATHSNGTDPLTDAKLTDPKPGEPKLGDLT